MTILLSLILVVTWGTWVTLAQIVPDVPQSARTLYVTLGSALVAVIALAIGGGSLKLGLRAFWLPVAGGVVWTLGNYTAFRAIETIGLARASGTWTPLNIVVAFIWGALLFGELDNFGAVKIAVLVVGFVLLSIGVVIVAKAGDEATDPELVPPADSEPRPTMPEIRAKGRLSGGLGWGVAAGLLWGTYFIPSQWSQTPAHVANVPLAFGALASAVVLAVGSGERIRLPLRVVPIQILSGCVFGIGNVTMLSLVTRVGTGVGFTIGQLSLVVNASLGIWLFKRPAPGTRAARTALIGIALAGIGGCAIGALK